MAKPLTAWVTNPNKNVNVTQYSSAAVTYSSATQDYVSATVGLNEQNKPATSWTSTAKTAVGWIFNANYGPNLYAYDNAALLYDSSNRTYDGLNGTQSPISTKPATAWTAV